MAHAVTVLEDADLLTLCLHQPRGRCGPQLARAVSLAARKMPMAAIAAELGYASPSAFSAILRRFAS